MDTTAANESILKTDVLGRVKTPASRREQLLDEFEQSGLSGQKFAELVGVKYQTFATWAQKRRRARGSYEKLPAKRRPGSEPVRWLQAVVQEAQQPDNDRRSRQWFRARPSIGKECQLSKSTFCQPSHLGTLTSTSEPAATLELAGSLSRESG